eukprot:IDg11525t1
MPDHKHNEPNNHWNQKPQHNWEQTSDLQPPYQSHHQQEQTASNGAPTWGTSNPAPWNAPAPKPAPAWRAPSQEWAQPAPAPLQQVPAQQWAPPPQSPSPSASPSSAPAPVLPGSSIQLENTNASATGNNSLSVGAERDRAAAAGNADDGNSIMLGATPGSALGFIGPLGNMLRGGLGGGAQMPVETPSS